MKGRARLEKTTVWNYPSVDPCAWRPIWKLGTIPLELFNDNILKHFLFKFDGSWWGLDPSKDEKMTWLSCNFKHKEQLINHNPRDKTRLLSILTDHWLLGKHGSRLGLTFNTHCRSCKDA